MSKPTPDDGVEFDFEFDAPQWTDLQIEKEKLEEDSWSPDNKAHDMWFQVVHPLHESKDNIISDQTKAPQRKSLLDCKSNKLSSEISKSGLPSRQKVDHPEDSKGNIFSQRKSSTEDREDSVKKLWKSWKLDEHGSFSISPKCPSLLKDKKTKRSSSLTKQSPCSLLPSRCSSDLSCVSESPNPKGCPKRISHPSVPSSPVKTTLRNKVKAATKTNPPKMTLKFREKVNTKSEEDKSLTDIDEELLTMLETHNKHILKKQAKYDENGRRIHKGNPMTCPAPTKTQSVVENSQARLKSKRRSVNVVRPDGPKNSKQKRRSYHTLSSARQSSPETSHLNTKTNRSTNLKFLGVLGNEEPKFKARTSGEKTSKTAQKQINGPTDAENEIKELIAQHNSKLAAKKEK